MLDLGLKSRFSTFWNRSKFENVSLNEFFSKLSVLFSSQVISHFSIRFSSKSVLVWNYCFFFSFFFYINRCQIFLQYRRLWQRSLQVPTYRHFEFLIYASRSQFSTFFPEFHPYLNCNSKRITWSLTIWVRPGSSGPRVHVSQASYTRLTMMSRAYNRDAEIFSPAVSLNFMKTQAASILFLNFLNRPKFLKFISYQSVMSILNCFGAFTYNYRKN